MAKPKAKKRQKPLAVYTIVDRSEEDRDDIWDRIGYAFVNKDSSINVYLNALPCNDKLHIREVKEKEEEEE